MKQYEHEVEQLAKHYAELVASHGDSPQAVQMPDRESQERRMAILCEAGPIGSAKILDFGCGTGQLLEYLRRERGFQGEYVGYDISPEMVALAQRKFPDARFEVRNILTQDIGETFDYVLISGVFNNRVTDNWGMMTAILDRLFPHVGHCLSFNALSRYVDFFDPGLAYVDPAEAFRFCKEHLSPRVNLRHDYCVKPGVLPYEFTMYVYSTDIAKRRLL